MQRRHDPTRARAIHRRVLPRRWNHSDRVIADEHLAYGFFNLGPARRAARRLGASECARRTRTRGEALNILSIFRFNRTEEDCAGLEGCAALFARIPRASAHSLPLPLLYLFRSFSFGIARCGLRVESRNKKRKKSADRMFTEGFRRLEQPVRFASFYFEIIAVQPGQLALSLFMNMLIIARFRRAYSCEVRHRSLSRIPRNYKIQ